MYKLLKGYVHFLKELYTILMELYMFGQSIEQNDCT